jgi:hypothetical protein
LDIEKLRKSHDTRQDRPMAKKLKSYKIARNRLRNNKHLMNKIHIRIEEITKGNRLITCKAKEKITTFKTKELTDKQRQRLSKIIGSVSKLKEELKENRTLERELIIGTLKGGKLLQLLSSITPHPNQKAEIQYILNKKDIAV